MKIPLPVCNPSDYARGGHVTVPLGRLGGALSGVRAGAVIDETGTVLPTQFDEVVAGDPTSVVLSFTLAQPLPAGKDSHYASPARVLTLDTEARPPGPAAELALEREPGGVRLINRRLRMWLNLAPSLNVPDERWYAGAATSVELDGREVLDASDDWCEHNLEKRIMQLDFIRLPQLDVPLHAQPYDTVSMMAGPVRATLTAASRPFWYHERRPFAISRRLECRAYRVISLYAGADYVAEELFVRAAEEGAWDRPEHLAFVPSYFSYMDVLSLRCSRHAGIPDWFAASSLMRPFLGYGFATDVHVGPLSHPHPEYPRPGKGENCFSWQLYPCVHARCVHLFSRYSPAPRDLTEGESFAVYEMDRQAEARRHFEDRIGRLWYEEIYKPLGINASHLGA